ncbi:DUF418 family protein [Edwardsiella ictaluri]|uniref:DUF418 domain-containing protein n=1 Tax=Edwardsiella ictaluri (strain 93-146) TaxID=634503 RepID=C5BCM0_EDWI9|nr:DUF418 domain-containing protein YeiB [Edwardsiella ictaluri]ACR68475.1 Protein of unknown function (DUF405) [Edwardsiella ictaluri 93-146]AVZ81197.1 DUF418 family protein [Edwardsiella ictaluri]EKS7763811.1 DUF418 family protein [Edwardsiella ictaluri]EKS7770593.1 DUF418 family protein [Edwardsiella ictaluri]EKS7773735.1 DUF418 family protein [Edwardsiella ictaluri]
MAGVPVAAERGRTPRIAALDALRGIALLGILLMNIIGFALPKAAYLNPAYQGIPPVWDQGAWLLLSLAVQGKFLAMFALLFGAGLQLQLPRGGRWIQARLGWLMLFGLLHTLLLWDGDILLAYGLIGLMCWRTIRDADSSRGLLYRGVGMYAVGVGILLLLAVMSQAEPHGFWQADYAEIQYETYWKLRGGVEAWRNRGELLISNLLALALQYGWQLCGVMLLGAGLMRCGWLRGRFSSAHYRRCGVGLLLGGLAIQALGSGLQWYLRWDFRWCGYLLQLPGELAAPLMMLGYVALIYAAWPRLSGWWLTAALQRVGRMALSNYLLQTLICTTLFYRLGLFNHAGRAMLLLWVLPVWGCCLLFATLWLRVFRQGPVEWLWRRLTGLFLHS